MSTEEENSGLQVKANLDPVIEATPTGLRYIFNLIFGKKHAQAERYLKLAEAQDSVDINLIKLGKAKFDHSTNELIEIKEHPTLFIEKQIANEETGNLLECTMHAANYIDDKRCNAKDDISQDFINRWRSEAKQISDETAQAIWGRLLAEETSNPGAISIRTLNTIRNMSTLEAKAFAGASKYVVFDQYIPDNAQGTIISNETFKKILDAQLIVSYTPGIYRGTSWPETNVSLSDGRQLQGYYVRSNNIFLFIETSNQSSDKPSFSYWELTAAGRELYKVLSPEINTSPEKLLEALKEKEFRKEWIVLHTKYSDIQNRKIDTESLKAL